MALEQFANNSQSALSVGIDNVTGVVKVIDASSFPSVPQFRIRVDAELMLVTAVAGNTFTATRGIEGTVAVTHNEGATVTQPITAAALLNLVGR